MTFFVSPATERHFCVEGDAPGSRGVEDVGARVDREADPERGAREPAAIERHGHPLGRGGGGTTVRRGTFGRRASARSSASLDTSCAFASSRPSPTASSKSASARPGPAERLLAASDVEADRGRLSHCRDTFELFKPGAEAAGVHVLGGLAEKLARGDDLRSGCPGRGSRGEGEEGEELAARVVSAGDVGEIDKREGARLPCARSRTLDCAAQTFHDRLR